jgi:two-component system, cell cycle sensor histidine kinase and response regulator CckA
MAIKRPRWLRPPVFDDPETTRVADLLNGTLLIAAGGACAYFLVNLLTDAFVSSALIAAFSLSMILYVALLKIILHRGRVRLVAVLLSMAVWGVYTVFILLYDGVRDTAVTGYFVAILITSISLGRPSLVLLDVLMSLSLILIYWAERQGLLVTGLSVPPKPLDLLSLLITLNATAALAGFVVNRLAVGERHLRRERDRAQHYLDIAETMIVALDIEGNVTLINRMGCDLLGCTEAEAVGRNWFTTFLPEGQRRATEAVFENLVAGATSELRYMENPVLDRDGEARWIAWHNAVIRDADGAVAGTLSSGIDITQRLRSEGALAASHERLLAILDGIEADVYVADLDSCEILFANEHMRAGFGENLVGRICYEVFRDAPGVCPHCTNPQLLTADGTPGEGVTWESHNPITDRWYVNHDRAIRWVDDRFVRLQVAMDITANRQAEQARERSQQLLLALSHAAQALQRANTPEAVYRTLGEQVTQLHLHAFILTLREGGSYLDLAYTTSAPDEVQAAEALTGLSAGSYAIPLTPGSLPRQVVADGRARFSKVTAQTLADALPQDSRHQSEALFALLGQQQRIVAPLTIGGEVRALLVITGSDLSESDLPAVTAFANQAAIAIENARLFRETQHLAAFNERIIDSMAEGLIVQDAEGVVTLANPAAERLLGYPPSGLIGRHWTAYTPSDQRAKVQAADARRLRGEADRYRLELAGSDGQRLHAWVSGSALFEDDGQFRGTTAIFSDITEQVRVQADLEASERRFRELFQSIPLCCFTFDREGVIGDWNRACETLFGWTAKEAVGQSMFDLVVREENAATTRENISRIFAGASVEGVEYIDHRADGTSCTVLAYEYPLRDGEGRISSAICAEVDITERKQAEAQLSRLAEQVQAQARQMAQILASVPVGVILLDAAGTILDANPAACSDLDALAGAGIGERLTQVGDRLLSELLTTPQTEGIWHEITAGNRIFEALARPVEHGAEPEHWVLVLNDVTRDRQIHDAFNQQERLAAVGQLAAGIAHDFNNILATLVLYTQMVTNAPELSDRSRERLAIVDQQAWDAARLIEQILDFSRRSLLERQPLDLAPLVKEQVKLLERTLPEHIRVVFVCEDGDYTLDADPTRMRQMLINLALNARDAMPDGGTLGIELTRAGEAGETIRLTISDTGTGISPKVLPHIFEPFFTTKGPGEGSGLGLPQVHGIVGQHGGHIDVQTAVGEGTTFTIDLPATGGAGAIPAAPADECLPEGAGETILVVEDNAALRNALIDIVEQLNYRACAAPNGKVALTALADHPDIALVLSDLVMPEMGGQALLHALRAQGRAIPMVMMTGHPLKDELEGLKAQGLVGWLQKPLDVAALAHLLAHALTPAG